MMGYYVFKSALLALLVILMIHVNITTSCLEHERIGLLGLRQLLESNGEDSSKHLPDWTEDSQIDCCEWERVTCDNTTGHVSQLFLSNLQDIRNIYEKIGEIIAIWNINCSLFLPFTELKTLDLSDNSFAQWETGYGFERLSALRKLEVLDLSSNKFYNDTIYHSLGAITSLKALLLARNSLEGSFPSNELVALVDLETLDLSSNDYHEGWSPKRGFEKLSVFKKLETLNLGSTESTVEILPYLNALPSLKVLNLQGNGFTRLFPAHELGDLANLESLDLSYNDFDEIQGLESLGKFKKLTSLNVRSTMFNRSWFQSLSPLTSLKNLSLADNNIGDPFPSRELTVFLNLERLDLTSNNLSSLTTKDCELLSKLNKLKHLDLSFNSFGKDVFFVLMLQ